MRFEQKNIKIKIKHKNHDPHEVRRMMREIGCDYMIKERKGEDPEIVMLRYDFRGHRDHINAILARYNGQGQGQGENKP